MKFQPFRCKRHDEMVTDEQGCPSCLAEWETLPDPITMTPEDRLAELDRIADQLTVPFAMAHKRIESLVGQPVATHEIALRWEHLREVASGTQ